MTTALNRLALGVGRGFTSALQTRLLTFLDAGIAGEQFGVTKLRLQFRVEFQQRARQPKLDRITLTAVASLRRPMPS
jgi:hypothetical protein